MNKAVVCCSESVTEETYKYICSRFSALVGETPEFVRENDGSLIGGFTVMYGGKFYDMSVKTQLSVLRKQLKG